MFRFVISNLKNVRAPSFIQITVKPLLSYGVAGVWLMAITEGVSGMRQLAHSSSFWPVIGTSYILHIPALREGSPGFF